MPNPSGPSRPVHSSFGPGTPLGYRIRQLRDNLGMTQHALAARAGVSVAVVRNLEQQVRTSCSLPTLHALARALDVPTAALIDTPRQLTPGGVADADSGEPPQGAVAIRHALTAVDDLTGDIGDALDVDPPTLDETRRALALGWEQYWAGRYDRLGVILPTAILRARAAVRDSNIDVAPAAYTLAAEVLRMSAATLVHVGYIDVAHLALREGLELAARGDDPLVEEALRASMVWKLLVEGRFAESQRLAGAVAAALEPGSARESLPRMSLYGAMLLSTATAAGRAGDRGTALHMVAESAPVAAVTGQRNDLQTAYGPNQVVMQEVDVHIVTEHYTAALEAARRMPTDSSMPMAAEARHLADVALAHTRLGRDDAALDVMERIETMGAGVWAGFQEQPRLVVSELWGHATRPPVRLRRLARRLGVA